MHSLTAAHPSLPFDTKVRVTNKENNKQVVLRINDRGPFVDGRIIDISKEAAKRLGMIGPGTAPVHLETASAHAYAVAPGKVKYTVQVGFFNSNDNAEAFCGRLRKHFPHASVQQANPGGYRVKVGSWDTRAQAERELARLRSGRVNGFVRALE